MEHATPLCLNCARPEVRHYATSRTRRSGDVRMFDDVQRVRHASRRTNERRTGSKCDLAPPNHLRRTHTRCCGGRIPDRPRRRMRCSHLPREGLGLLLPPPAARTPRTTRTTPGPVLATRFSGVGRRVTEQLWRLSGEGVANTLTGREKCVRHTAACQCNRLAKCPGPVVARRRCI